MFGMAASEEEYCPSESTLQSVCSQYDMLPTEPIGYALGDDTISHSHEWDANEDQCFDIDRSDQCYYQTPIDHTPYHNYQDHVAATAAPAPSTISTVAEVLSTHNSNHAEQYYGNETYPPTEPSNPIQPSSVNNPMEPIKLSLHVANNGHYCMQYDYTNGNELNGGDSDRSNNPYAYIHSPQYRYFLESLKQKILDNELDMFCHICNYGFKSFPRLIRHMETKRHAIQIERFRLMNLKNNPHEILQQTIGTTASAINSSDASAFDNQMLSKQNDELHEESIQAILDSFINEFNDKSDIFNDIELKCLDDIDNSCLDINIL